LEGATRRLGDADWTLLDLPLLARLTAVVALSFGISGPSCLATSEIDFPPVAQTPPHLRANYAVPPLGKVIVVPSDKSPAIQFEAVVESEDANNSLEAFLIADDLAAASPNILAYTFIAPGKSGQERVFSLTYDPSLLVGANGVALSVGCHPITLVVSPSYNFFSDQPSDPSLEDIMVWWLVKGDATSSVDAVLATSCPSLVSGSQTP
jgi:hypothetical protein